MSTVPTPHFVLLNSGRAYFPALLFAIEQAQHSVSLETYIFDFNGLGGHVATALCDAARRGVQVRVLVDGVGTPTVPTEWRDAFARSGVAFVQYSPLGPLGLLIPSRWRRLHRKLCVVDRQWAFCGGINVLDDWHDPNHGPLPAPRLDYALQIRGPLVRAIAYHTDALWMKTVGQPSPLTVNPNEQNTALTRGKKALAHTTNRLRQWSRPSQWVRPHSAGGELGAHRSQLILRDNVRNRRSIERAYLSAIAGAKHDITLANAYFLPGKPLRLALVRAAKRGVKVRVLLQGRYEYFMQYYAARAVYLSLLNAGVEIYEYAPSFLHAKVAVVDAQQPNAWATVGSSNLDPLSLLLAREANVAVIGQGIPKLLHAQLQHAIETESKPVFHDELNQASLGRKMLNWLAYALMRAALFLTGKRY